MAYSDFDTFNCVYNIKIEIENLTPLSIGSGKSALGASDNPIIRLRDTPYIPGSSLKGVIRTEVERYARARYGPNSVCDILNPNDELSRQDRPCLVCSVFGGPTIASHVFFFNAVIKQPWPIAVIRRVSIDRDTGASIPGRLYDTEQIEPGAKFEGEIRVENIDLQSNVNDSNVELVKYSLRLLENGLFIGGRKSIGNGLIKAEIKEINVLRISDNRIVSSKFTSPFWREGST